MLAQPSRDWNVFKQIFAEHWDGFTRAHPRYQTSYYDDLVAKMLACGNPDKMGYLDRLAPIKHNGVFLRGSVREIHLLLLAHCFHFTDGILRKI